MLWALRLTGEATPTKGRRARPPGRGVAVAPRIAVRHIERGGLEIGEPFALTKSARLFDSARAEIMVMRVVARPQVKGLHPLFGPAEPQDFIH